MDHGAGGVPESAALVAIARAAIELSRISPRLTGVAGEIHRGAATQLDEVRSIADATRATTVELSEVSAQLRTYFDGVSRVMGLIQWLSGQTHMIALNTRIEAGRAGETGKVFNVIAEEIQALAARTSANAGEVRDAVRQVAVAIDRTAAAVGDTGGGAPPSPGAPGHPASGDGTRGDARLSLVDVSERVTAVASITDAHHAAAETLDHLGAETRRLTENLLIAVGALRFEVHDRARAAFGELLAGPLRTDRAAAREDRLRDAIRRFPFFELLYLTDPAGRQVTPNVGGAGFVAAYGSTGLGCDWSDRPWFRAAAAMEEGVYVSDLYRSAATDDFCFTLSGRLRDGDGRWIGVLAGDVRFGRLL